MAPSIADHPSHHALESLVEAVDKHDTYRRGHSRRVAAHATNLARIMGSPPAEVALVNLAGLLHDVGKIGIPEWLLRKRGSLTEAELHLIRLHPIMGASLLSKIPDMEAVVPIVLHHHECWDGTGYPSKLKGIEIPLESRLIFTVEAFDAITSQKGDDDAGVQRALETIRELAGKRFDPLTVDAMHEAYRAGMLDAVQAEHGNRSIIL